MFPRGGSRLSIATGRGQRVTSNPLGNQKHLQRDNPNNTGRPEPVGVLVYRLPPSFWRSGLQPQEHVYSRARARTSSGRSLSCSARKGIREGTQAPLIAIIWRGASRPGATLDDGIFFNQQCSGIQGRRPLAA
jgi:hypothetical protein